MDEINSTTAPSLRVEGESSTSHAQTRRYDDPHLDDRSSDNSDPAALDFRDEAIVPNNNFAFSPTQLHKLLTARSIPALGAFGGLLGLAAGLRTDVDAGLSVDETDVHGTISFEEAVAAGRAHRPATIIEPANIVPEAPVNHGLHLGPPPDRHYIDRKRIFGANSLPRRKQKSFLKLMWIAFNDKLIILLTISATISLAIGIYQTVDPSIEASRIEWVDGVTIVAAILIIVLASAAMDWQKNQKFKKLNERKEQRDVKVIRSGRVQYISVYDVMVGDVMLIEAGEVIAVDGVLTQASSLQIDESSISGESDLVHKKVANDMDYATPADPFILSGTTVCRGVGRYVVTSVGLNSTYGRILMSLRNDVEETPLQAKLGRLGKQLIIVGTIAGSIFFFVLMMRFLAHLSKLHEGPSEKAEGFLHILIISVTLVVITVPEGLALNVTIALAFATKRMLKDNNLVRLLRSCEIMGNATSVCSDKTGTLTQGKMNVVTGRLGLEGRFDDTELAFEDPTTSMSRASTIKCDTSMDLMATLSAEVKDLIRHSIALNSTAFESDSSGMSEFVGSSTETALLEFCRRNLGMRPLAEERANCPVIAMLPFDSSRKWMAVLVKLPNGAYRLLVKGAAELVFEYCAYLVSDPTWRLPVQRIQDGDRTSFHNTIQEYASKMLRPVAIAFRDFNESDVLECSDNGMEYVNLEWLASGLVFIGAFGLCDPLRPRVVDSVRQCQNAGVFVRMVTGDNFLTAKAIATECGIYTPGGIAMDGPTFRDLTPTQMDAVIPRLQVLARSSPEDKLLLVTHLKGMKETVAVTGDGTNDALALKAADVGFAMGVQGTEVAKEAASIILLDDNFTSIVKALRWGRAVNDSVKRFCQFQFTINVTAGIITVVSELVGDAIFTVPQLLWINLIMDIFASLALATDEPASDILQRKPEPRNAPIISITMWKMILGQALYQLVVIFVVHYAGWDLFNPDTEFEIEKLQTFVFNIYVWMQFFNQQNCRRTDNKTGIWSWELLRNPWFIGAQLVTIAGQFVIIFHGGEAFDTRPLTGAQWGWSILFGVLTLLLGALIRQFPDRLVLRFFKMIGRYYNTATKPIRSIPLPSFMKRRKAKGKAKDEQDQEMGVVQERIEGSDTNLVRVEQQKSMSSSQGEASTSRGGAKDAQEAKPPRRDLDLQGLVDAAKLGRGYSGAILEIHPRTLKDDPIIFFERSARLPPSQDHEIMRPIVRQRNLPVPTRAAEVPRHRHLIDSPRQTLATTRQTRQQPRKPTWRDGEWWLRSKRR